MKNGFVHTSVRMMLAGSAALFSLQAATFAAPATIVSPVASSIDGVLASEQDDATIRRAFRSVLNREPSNAELRRYRVLMHEEYWTESDVRDDLKSRPDYRRQSRENVDNTIRRAYEDILHREPDSEGLRSYRREMLDNGWTEHEVRQALRKSSEHDSLKEKSADRIVTRAYRDVLGRDPDVNGLVSYRNQVVNHGWDEHDLRQALMKSPEYRQKNAMTRDAAVQIVRRAYQGVLGREPDAGGLEAYVQKVLRDHWSEADLARELRHSDEYRNKRR